MPRPLIVLFVVATALLLGLWYAAGQRPVTPAIALSSGSALVVPRDLAAFSLSDGSGTAFTREHLEGRWTLMFIGFTHCPDVCPQFLALLDAVTSRVQAHGAQVETVFVSVDPERDTPSQLAAYVAHFNPDFMGVTGPKAELDRLCDSLGFAYVRVPGAVDYTVDHSTAVALIDPRARVAGYFTQPLDVIGIANDIGAVAH